MTSPSASRSWLGCSGSSRETKRSPNSVLGSSRADTSAGIWSRWSGSIASSMVAPSALASTSRTWPTITPAHLDVGGLLQLTAGRVGLQRHPGDLGERLVVRRHGRPQQQGQDDEEREPLQPYPDDLRLARTHCSTPDSFRSSVAVPREREVPPACGDARSPVVLG